MSKKIRPKYGFTGETKRFDGVLYKRIRALRNLYNDGSLVVHKGDIGGWIQAQRNLSHAGSCWVYDEASVGDNARVIDGALVKGHASLRGNSTAMNLAIIRDFATLWHFAVAENQCDIRGHSRISNSARVGDRAALYDNCVVKGEARICGHTTLSGNIEVSEKACISGGDFSGPHVIMSNAYLTTSDEVISFTGVGSEQGTLTAYQTCDLDASGRRIFDVGVTRGCYVGTIDQFEERVRCRYGSPDAYARIYVQYLGLVNIIRHHFGLLTIDKSIFDRR